MQRLVVVASLALTMTMVPAQEAEEIGEMQHMLGNIFSNQLNTLRSSCCVIRDLMCPQIRRPPTSFRNSSGLSDALEQFSACVCSSGGRCTLTYPEIFLPDGADGVTYDVTFVTLASTSQYICTYSGTRTLTCHFRQSMRTGFMEWLLPGVVSGTSAAVGNSGIFGEEMEEVVEQMMERGLPPAPLPSRQCRRCVPLQCAVNVIREAQLHETLAARQMGPYRYPQSSLYPQRPTPSVPAYSDQQRFHQCLKRNAIRPPSPTPPTTTPRDPQPSTPFPVTPPPDGRPDATPMTPPPINDVSSTPKTWWTTPELPATSPKPGRVSTTTQYKTFTTTDLPTTKSPPATTSSTSDVTTSRATPTPAPTTYVPPEITRILIGDSLVAVATTPTSNNVIVMPKEGTEGGGNIGVGGIAGIVTGVVLAVAAFSGCLVFAIVIARRRRKQREGLNTSTSSTTPVTSSSAHTASSWHLPTHHHHHTAHLHTVSSTQAVIDADEASIDSEDDDDVIKKIDDDDDDDDNIDMKSISSEASERYTPAHLMKSSLRPVSLASASTTKLTSLANRPPMRKPSVTSKASSVKSGEGDDCENLYASLDETTIVPPRHSLIDDVNGASASSKSTRSSTKNNPTYSNTDMSRRMRKSSKDEAIYAKPYAKPPRYSEVMRDDAAMTSRDGESYVNSRSASEYEGLRHNSRKPSHKYTPLSFHGAQGADERGGMMVGRGGGGGGGGGEGVGGRERGIGGASGDPNYLHPCLPPSDESFRKRPAGLITGTEKVSTYSQSDASNPGIDRTTKPSLAGPPGRAKANTSGRRESNTPRRDSRNDDCDTRRVDNYRPTLPRRDVPGGGGGAGFRQDGASKKGESASGGGSRVDRDGYLIPMPAKRQ